MRIFYIFSIIVLTNICSYSQVNITINITPDEFPGDISWDIKNQNAIIVASGDLNGCEPFQMCSESFELDDECLVFTIRDQFGDGINMPGSYELYLNNELVQSGNNFIGKEQFDVNCRIGESCKNAIVLDLPDNSIKAPTNKDYWFRLIPEVTGLYRINTCPNPITGLGHPDTEMWVYESCDSDLHQEGAEGSIGYSDDSSDCPPASGFNYVPLEKDKLYLIKTRMKDPTWPVDSMLVRVLKLPPLSACTDPAACNFNPFASADNGSCIYDSECLPDLKLDEEELQNSLVLDRVFKTDECLIEEGCLTGSGWRDVIRFSTKIDNIGTADYIVGIPERNPQNFTKENCHGHWHHLGYAEYLLFSGSGRPEPVGFKNGFCVLDLSCESADRKYLCSYMGITAGCSDIYDSEIDCQWIDITDLPDGDYTLVVRINWNRLPDMRNLQEKTYENNWGQVCIQIDRSSGELLVNVNENCPEYTDCLGMTFGQATIDCEGNCGGDAEFGDFNNDKELSYEDTEIYLDRILNKLSDGLNCYDLNGDGLISLGDIAALDECMVLNFEQEDNPFHTHCNFPVPNSDPNQNIYLNISDFRPDLNYFDISLKIPDNDIYGLQIPIQGVDIDSISFLESINPSYFESSQNELIVYYKDGLIDRDVNYKPFFRLYFSNIISDSLCLKDNAEVISKDFQVVNSIIESGCIFLTSNDENLELEGLNIFPNPLTDILNIQASFFIDAIIIKDLNGQELIQSEIQSKEAALSIRNLPSGIYLLSIKAPKSQNIVKKIIKID